MDRLSGDLDHGNEGGEVFDPSNVPLITNEEFLLRRSQDRLALPERLFMLDELDVHYDSDQRALWTFMNPKARPSFTPPMLAEFEQWQSLITHGFGPGLTPLDFLILGSRSPGVFCFGGDLQLFAALIRSGDRDGLVRYGNRCVEILDRNLRSLNLPMLTIGLVQGQALGGGFEALLSFDFIIAERGSSFGLPETMPVGYEAVEEDYAKLMSLVEISDLRRINPSRYAEMRKAMRTLTDILSSTHRK
ncbi:MAG: hypothetical protein EBY21_14205 [Alphaproteobacteria bacterium]|nr:hypothetical protein [Alphaproteobacteria bacterium]